MAHTFDVSAEPAEQTDGTPGIGVKISSAEVEINIWFSKTDAAQVRKVLTLTAGDKAAPLGTCANVQVHWAKDADGRHYLLVGHDDETWDVGITLDEVTLRSVLSAVAKCEESEV